jgi:hypothetical protein
VEAPPAGKFLAVSAGGDHACGLTVQREIKCWGTAAAKLTPASSVAWYLPADTRRLADAPALNFVLPADAWAAFTETYGVTTETRFESFDALFTETATKKIEWPGGVCGEPSQYNLPVGELHVVSRPDLDMTFVVEPGTDASIEVTGTGLLAETDRLVVVNCQDTCGLHGASSAVGVPNGVGARAAAPLARPEQGVPCPEDAATLADNPDRVEASFREVPSRFCSTPQPSGFRGPMSRSSSRSTLAQRSAAGLATARTAIAVATGGPGRPSATVRCACRARSASTFASSWKIAIP